MPTSAPARPVSTWSWTAARPSRSHGSAESPPAGWSRIEHDPQRPAAGRATGRAGPRARRRPDGARGAAHGEYEDADLDDSDFAALGTDFERGASGAGLRTGPVGSAHSRLLGLVDAVDFSQGWLREHRTARAVPE
ncbi:AAC(3) family N-acetyltransferase [Streptomyces sp. NBC_01210]|uniref:AAC(3) family N-acetyltransferase n=1 Tax=Streptomyces sp. NBC_01210 TaxID=2903774 RepID=UPI002E10BC5C|nr:AAC(3) family N-acetyltransferase [Streptomyces sp. NBC_01210]